MDHDRITDVLPRSSKSLSHLEPDASAAVWPIIDRIIQRIDRARAPLHALISVLYRHYSLCSQVENIEWFSDQLDAFVDDDYILLDCPGQVRYVSSLLLLLVMMMALVRYRLSPG